jgi:hypothetical protein
MLRLAVTAMTVLIAIAAMVGLPAQSASAHVLPSSTVVLDMAFDAVDASLRIPLDDLEAASGIDLGDGTTAEIAAHEAELRAYILDQFAPSSPDGAAWTVTVGDFGSGSTEESGTGVYSYVTATAHLVPPAGADIRDFDLGYAVVVHQVITHAVIVSVRSDWSTGTVGTSREIGTIRLDTVTNTVTPLHVDLGDGSAWTGFASMVAFGIDHIREGVDHQLFLLTLLLPAPLLVIRRRWAGVAPPKRAVRRIAAITLSFTLGHSLTLALGTLGLPVPQQAIEALIAVSILVAAMHAVRPIFPGREALIAVVFGLVHGLAFSATLTELDLSGSQLALSLLGFNLGVELMQLAVVALVLPPLILLARTPAYTPVRVIAAALAGIAALGWLAARLRLPNALAEAADRFAGASVYLIAALWIAAIVTVAASGSARVKPAGPPKRAKTVAAGLR